MEIWEYLLLGFSFLCMGLALLGAIMILLYPEEQCINEYLKDKKIQAQKPDPSQYCLKVEGPENVLKQYPLNEKSFKQVFKRTLPNHKIETLYRVWRTKPFHLEFRFDLTKNNIGEAITKDGELFVKLIWNLKGHKMYETLLFLLEKDTPKLSPEKLVNPPVVEQKPIIPIPNFSLFESHQSLERTLQTQKQRGDKILTFKNKEWPLNEYNLRLLLKQYVPKNAIEYCITLWLRDPFHLSIVDKFAGDNDTFGTFSNFEGKKKCVISILESLAANTFFWTFIHETAHLMAYRRTGTVKHCATFYRCFKQIGYPVLEANIFSPQINQHLYSFFESPNRYSALDRRGRAA